MTSASHRRRPFLVRLRRIVVKIGSNVLASRGHGVNQERIRQIAHEVAVLHAKGLKVVLVSSGAILLGLEKLGLTAWPRGIPLRQAAAAAGQSRLMWTYEQTFEAEGLRVAQVLLTHADLASRPRHLNARRTLLTLMTRGVVPIINENDTVAVEELTFGDNDRLAGQVAALIAAQGLIILSDVDGLCTADPRTARRATLIPFVARVTPAITRLAGGASGFGRTGGMASKVEAATWAARHGVFTIVMNGEKPRLLGRILAGEEAGTFFAPASAPKRRVQRGR